MGLQLLQVSDSSEFYEIVDLERKAFEHPNQNFIELIIPLDGALTGEGRRSGIEGSAERQAARFRSDPTVTWIKVVDDSNDQILGAAQWVIFDHDPYTEQLKMDCTWWKEGLERNVANHLMAQHLSPRQEFMHKPHIFLNVCFTVPEARRRGVGNLLMEWGARAADERGYDSYVDATDPGRLLYQRHGFIEGPVRHFSVSPFQESKELDDLKQRLLPHTWWPMYRPAGGVYDPQKTTLPW